FRSHGIVHARALAEGVLKVPGVSAVCKDDTSNADAFDDREFDLELVIGLRVSADGLTAHRRDSVGVGAAWNQDSRSYGEREIAADRVDATEIIAFADRHAFGQTRGNEPGGEVCLEDERPKEFPVEANEGVLT